MFLFSIKINVRNFKNGFFFVIFFLDVNWIVFDLNVSLLEYKYCIGKYFFFGDIREKISYYSIKNYIDFLLIFF